MGRSAGHKTSMIGVKCQASAQQTLANRRLSSEGPLSSSKSLYDGFIIPNNLRHEVSLLNKYFR